MPLIKLADFLLIGTNYIFVPDWNIFPREWRINKKYGLFFLYIIHSICTSPRRSSVPTRTSTAHSLWTGVHLLASRQRLSGVDNDRGLARVMVVLCNRVHSVIGVGPFLVDTLHSAVSYRAAIVPGNFRTHWNRLERSFLFCSHDASPAW